MVMRQKNCIDMWQGLDVHGWVGHSGTSYAGTEMNVVAFRSQLSILRPRSVCFHQHVESLAGFWSVAVRILYRTDTYIGHQA